MLKKLSKFFDIDFYELVEEKSLNQTINDNGTGYLSENQVFNFSEKLIEQFEKRIIEKDILIEKLEKELERFQKST